MLPINVAAQPDINGFLYQILNLTSMGRRQDLGRMVVKIWFDRMSFSRLRWSVLHYKSKVARTDRAEPQRRRTSHELARLIHAGMSRAGLIQMQLSSVAASAAEAIDDGGGIGLVWDGQGVAGGVRWRGMVNPVDHVATRRMRSRTRRRMAWASEAVGCEAK